MRCHICDQVLEKIQFNEFLEIEPCTECQEVIDEALGEFPEEEEDKEVVDD